MSLIDPAGNELLRMPQARRRALRSHDITHGLQNVDQRNAAVTQLRATRIIGWTAAVAGNLREQNVEDLDALQAVVAQTLGVEGFAFAEVLRTIEETELGIVQRRRGSKNVLYMSDVAYATMYDRLGEQWLRKTPSAMDEATVGVLDAVAITPRRESALTRELGLESGLHDMVLRLGDSTHLLKFVTTADGERFVYTPFYAFENAAALVTVLQQAGGDDVVRAAFESVRNYQGLAVDGTHPVLQAAVKAGLIPAPTIDGVTGSRTFAVLPFSVPPELRLIKKQVLDKAQAVLASVRYGQNFGAQFRIRDPIAVLSALAERKRLEPHSEHASQYFVLAKLHIVRLVRSLNWYAVELIDTDDNTEAVRIALDLARYGELVEQRMTDRRSDVQALVESSKDYRHPLYAIEHQRPSVPLPDVIVHKMLESIQGGSPVV